MKAKIFIFGIPLLLILAACTAAPGAAPGPGSTQVEPPSSAAVSTPEPPVASSVPDVSQTEPELPVVPFVPDVPQTGPKPPDLPEPDPIQRMILQWTERFSLDMSQEENPLTEEEIACRLFEQFMKSLMEESDQRLYRITAYKDLRVNVTPTLEFDEPPRDRIDGCDLRWYEWREDAWLVEADASFQFEGIISPIGPSSGDQWFTAIHQGSAVDFLMWREGDVYFFQSRYLTDSELKELNSK